MTESSIRRRGTARISIWLSALCFLAQFAQAQVLDHAPNPAVSATDDISVDLKAGRPVRTMTRIAIGPSGSPRLSYGVFSTTSTVDTATYGTASEACVTYDNIPGCIYLTMYYNLGGDSEVYSVSPPSTTAPAGFTEQGSMVGTVGGVSNTITRKDGTVWQLSGASSSGVVGCVQSVTYPDGEVLTYNYNSGVLQSVVSTAGYMIHLEGGGVCYGPEAPAKVVLINLNTDYCDPFAATCTGLTQNWPTMTYSGWGTSTVTATDNLGRTWTQTETDGTGYFQWRYTTPQGVWFEYRSNFTGPYNPSGEPYVWCDARSILQWLNTPVGQWNYTFTGTGDCKWLGPTTGVSTAPDGVTQQWDGSGFIDGDNRRTGYAIEGYSNFFGSGQTAVTEVLQPENNKFDFSYDNRLNPVQTTETAKSGSGTISASASYPATCTADTAKVCNKPAYTIDANGNRTDYTYDPQHGGVLTKTLPPDKNGIRPQERYTYQQISAQYKNSSGQLVSGPPIWKLTDVSSCKTTASCAGTTDEVITHYDYDGNLLPITVTVKDGTGAIFSIVKTSYDPIGNVISVFGPVSNQADANAASPANTTYYFYDSARQKIGEIGHDPADGTNPRPATRTTYNLDGQPTKIETGTAPGTTLSSLNAMTTYSSVDMVYDNMGRMIQKTTSGGGVAYDLTQYSYDIRGRLVCTAQRMNWNAASGAFGTEPADACTLSTPTNYGPDRITKNSYDAAGQLMQVTRAFGTAQAQNYATYTYSLNGKQTSVTDANGNLTANSYNGFDRLAQTTFPSKTTHGQTNSADYETYAYDANGNRTSLQKRDGRIINYEYDALNRVVVKYLPGATGTGICYDYAQSGPNDVCYDYDLRGLTLDAKFTSLTGVGLSYAYDSLGRRLSETSYGQTIGYQYDAHGNRTQLTWPDGYAVGYGYDGLDRMVAACGNGTFVVATWSCSGTTALAGYGYDHMGHLAWIQYGSGAPAAKVSASWTPVGDLLTLGHDLAGTANDVSFTDTYTPAHQIASSAISNPLFQYSQPASATAPYAVNGLNQYTSVSGQGIVYDANGNLTSDGTLAFTYDVENRLIAAAKTGMSATYAYDPAGRRMSKIVTGGSYAGTTFFLDAGDDEIAEYDGSGNLLRRYVPGRGVDRPIAMVTAAGAKSFFHQDKTGSVIAMSDTSGNIATNNGVADGPYTYDAYGNCLIGGAACSGGVPYKYTGRRYDPETGLYFNRARFYSAAIGRFLQTDPVGYKDDLDWYTYVGNDPTNETDPTGECIWDGCYAEAVATGAAIGAIGGVVGQAISDVVTGSKPTFSNYAGAFVGGAAQGGTFVATGGNAVIAGAVGGAVAQGTTSAIEGDRGDVIASKTIAGGVVGAATGGLGNKFTSLAGKGIAKLANSTVLTRAIANNEKMTNMNLGKLVDAAFGDKKFSPSPSTVAKMGAGIGTQSAVTTGVGNKANAVWAGQVCGGGGKPSPCGANH